MEQFSISESKNHQFNDENAGKTTYSDYEYSLDDAIKEASE